jgi:hypothetical protein
MAGDDGKRRPTNAKKRFGAAVLKIRTALQLFNVAQLAGDQPQQDKRRTKWVKVKFELTGGGAAGFLKGQRQKYADMRNRAENLLDRQTALQVDDLTAGVDLSKEIPICDQGDTSLYTHENLLARYALRVHPSVSDSLDSLCDVLDLRVAGYGKSICMQAYEDMMSRFYKCIAGLWDEDKARARVALDWEQETRKQLKDLSSKMAKKTKSDDDDARDRMTNQEKILTRDVLKRILFELADVWCDDIDAASYADFITSMHNRVTMHVDEVSRGLRVNK